MALKVRYRAIDINEMLHRNSGRFSSASECAALTVNQSLLGERLLDSELLLSVFYPRRDERASNLIFSDMM